MGRFLVNACHLKGNTRMKTLGVVTALVWLITPTSALGAEGGEPLDTQEMVAAAHAVEQYVLDLRRELHTHPETRWEESWTLQRVWDECYNMTRRRDEVFGPWHVVPDGESIRPKGGFVLNATFDPSFDRILFRADVDALPVTEATGLPFASTIPGKMHACGHDVHMAMLMGALKAIAEGRVKPTHNLRFVFQRAEENPGAEPRADSGGKVLVDEGVLDGITSVHGLHIWAASDGTPGVFYSRPGQFMANSDRWCITITAKGGHVMAPHHGVNALRVANAIMTALEGFPNRILGPNEAATLEPVICKSGTGTNIMPASAELWYGVRTLLAPTDRDLYFDRLESEVRAVALRFPAEVEFKRVYGHPALINDSTSVRTVGELLRANDQSVEERERILGGEDFAHYLYGAPGSFWMLGAYQEGSGDHHSPTFNPDERVFWQGVLYWLALASN